MSLRAPVFAARAAFAAAMVAAFLLTPLVPSARAAIALPEPFVVTVTIPVSDTTLTGSATLAATTSADAASLTFVFTPTVGGSSSSVDGTGTGTTWRAAFNSGTLANGAYTLIARAFHGGEFTDSAPVSVNVSNIASAPPLATTLTLPIGGATIAGEAALAATTNVVADSLTFVVRNDAGDTVASISATGAGGTAWSGVWNSTTVPNGRYGIRAFAAKGTANAASSAATVTVSNAPPPPVSISITLDSPTDGATVLGSVPLAATTSDTPDSVSFVVTRMFGDHQTFTISATGAATAWSATWSAGSQANGQYSIVARAMKEGAETASPAATVTLNNPASGTSEPPPVVVATVTSPTAGITVSGTTTLVAATNIAVNAVTFVLRDAANASAPPVATVSATAGGGSVSWSAVVNSATVPDGSYVLIARANKDGVVTPSAPVAISVLNAAPPAAEEEALSLTITTPAPSATLNGMANLSATSNLPLDGLTFVITGGTGPISLAATGSQTRTVWTASWDSSSVPNGAYSIRPTFVRAGVSAQGVNQAFTVSNATVAVTIAAPSNNADVHGVLEVVVSAVPDASSVGVKITNTQDAAVTSTRNATFDAGRQVWVISWNTVDFRNGMYRLDAKGIGTLGREFFATPVTVRVANEAADVPREFAVRIVAPADGTTAVGPIALVAAVDGDAAGVQFFASPDGAGAIVRLDATFDGASGRWVATWRTALSANATYAVGAVAVNAQNAKTESARINVRVANPVREEIVEVPLSVRILEPGDGAAEGVVRFAAATEGAVVDVRVFVRIRGGGADAQVLRAAFDAGRKAWLAPWDSSSVPNGTYEAVAVARDAAGKEASSGVISLFVERRAPESTESEAPSTPPAGTGPAVAFVRPQNGAQVHGIVVLAASASAVAKVGFAIRAGDGTPVFNRGAVRAADAWAITWDTTAVRDGRYLIDAVGFDQGGQRVATSQIAVSVTNAGGQPVERIDAVPVDVVREMIREIPSGTVALRVEQLPPVTDGEAKQNAECAKARIPADKCSRWLATQHGSTDCRSAGILTKEECVSYLRQKAGGEVAECQGRSAEACADELAKKTAGLLDSAELGRLHDAIAPSIGKSLRVRPRPVEGEPVEKDVAPSASDAPDDLARYVPLVSRKPIALRVHASPAFAKSGDKASHQSVPAVLFVDSDGDGLPDDVEKRLRTDPHVADTDGDGYGDAVEMRAGYNPRGRGVLADGVKLAPIDVAIMSGAPIEHPKSAGELVDFLKVDDVQTPETDDGGDVVLRGRANPGDVVTVFVYSYLPVVFTTTAEEDGTWSYELGSSLSDGEHEVYATVTDETGKIKSKSGVLSFFVNEAKAVEESAFFQPEEALAAETSPLIAAQAEAPVRRFAGWYVGGAALLVLVALILAYFLFFRPRSGNVPPPAA